MRLPGGPARFLKTRYAILAFVAVLVVVASVTGFVWADKSVTLVVDGISTTVTTDRGDVASLLSEAGVVTREGDLVSPGASSSLSDGAVVVVRHAVPVTLCVGDETLSLKVLGRTVADALVMAGMDPTGGLHSEPAPDEPLEYGMKITATDVFFRVSEEDVVLPFNTIVQGDPKLPLNAHKVITAGSAGQAVRVWQVLVTGGVEGTRTLKVESVVRPAVNQVVAVGTKRPFKQVMVAKRTARPRPAPTPRVVGRALSMQSTAYTPFECGQGVGWVASKKRAYRIPDGWGIVAVDPKVIPLGSRLFVEGYGYAVACDTGGAIHGSIIDVCFWGSDLNASTSGATASQRQAANNQCDRWGRRYSVRVTVLGK